MHRYLIGAVLIASCALAAYANPAAAPHDRRTMPMTFALRAEGPAPDCGEKCRVWVAAFGAITPDTPREFAAFAKAHDLRGAVLALDSGGGSVLGTLEMGRMVRGLDMTTTVGTTVEHAGTPDGAGPATLSPRADCESMCVFLLLAGTRRHVPAQARLFVHQIWIGDKRDDATAVNYSAEDIALIQRDIGRIARYMDEMGGPIELLDIAMRSPPWERMRELSAEELRRTRLSTVDQLFERSRSDSTISASQSSNPSTVRLSGARGWTVINRAGRPNLVRRHPLTIEGEEIGSFDLSIACVDNGNAYEITYSEQRKKPVAMGAAEPLKDVAVVFGREAAPLKVVSSKSTSGEVDSLALGVLPAAFVQAFAQWESHTLTVETSSVDNVETAIRVGNTGAAKHFPKLAAACTK